MAKSRQSNEERRQLPCTRMSGVLTDSETNRSHVYVISVRPGAFDAQPCAIIMFIIIVTNSKTSAHSYCRRRRCYYNYYYENGV